MRLLGRLLLGGLALVLAIPCGTLVLGAGLLIDPVSRDALGALGLVGIIEGLNDLAAGLPPDVVIAALAAFARALGLLLVVPPVLVAVIGETLRLRGLAWYGGATGLLTAALPVILRGDGRPVASAQVFTGEARILGTLFVAGAASGSVYWLVARHGSQGGMAQPSIRSN